MVAWLAAPLTAEVKSAELQSVKVDAAKEDAGGKKASTKEQGTKEEGTKAGTKKESAAYEEPLNGCCGRPGMIPVCRCVPVTKKKQKTEYDMKCELVCVPGCGPLHCKPLHDGHHGCSDGVSCCDQPDCHNATIRTKKTLLKKVVDEEEDGWEYKVEWVCASCAVGCCTPSCCDTGCSGTSGTNTAGNGHRKLGSHLPGRFWHASGDLWSAIFHRK